LRLQGILGGGTGLKRAIFMRTGGLILLLAAGVWVASSVFVVRDQRSDERIQARALAEFMADRLARLPRMESVEALSVFLRELVDSHASIAYVVVERDGQPAVHTLGAGAVPRRRGESGSGGRQVTVEVVEDVAGVSYYDAMSVLGRPGIALRIGTIRPGLGPETWGVLRSIAVGGIVSMILGLGLSWTVASMTTREVSQAEAALRESVERYRLLFEQAPDSIMLMDIEPGERPVIREANEATGRMHGMPVAEILGKPISMLDVPGDAAKVGERTRRIMSGEVVSFEAEHLRSDGTVFPVEVIARKIEIDGRPAIQAIDRDISERRSAEEEKRSLEAQLQQSQKMEAIGRLAGGIAHDMNNVLAAIMGAISILNDELGPDHPQSEAVANLISACNRGRELTRNFLGYARKGKYAPENLDLNELIRETRDLLSRTIPKTVALETRLDADLDTIRGDRSLINQAVMNVCINAVDAVAGAGTVTITTDRAEPSESAAADRTDADTGGFVRVEVSDTGSGMDAQTLAKAFEPFFTTKPAGKGTGLGLAMVHGAMKSHGGDVTIESTLGVGTTVALVLPAGTSSRALPTREEPAAVEVHSGTGLILLVDDENLVAWSGQKMLESMGYQVELARDGQQALDAHHRLGSRIDLVILDLVMPEMDGRTAFYELQKVNPEVRVVVSTGFSHDETVEELLGAGAVGFIEKPYDKRTLSEAVRTALSG